jgi:hypothetical protein
VVSISKNRLKIGNKKIVLILLILAAIASVISIAIFIILNQLDNGEPSR